MVEMQLVPDYYLQVKDILSLETHTSPGTTLLPIPETITLSHIYVLQKQRSLKSLNRQSLEKSSSV